MPSNSISDSLKVLFLIRAPQIKRYFKMCLVGFTGMFVQFLIFNVLRDHMRPVNAAQIAMISAVVNNYFLNKRYTFKERIIKNSQQFKTLSLFVAYSLWMIFLQRYWFNFMIPYVGQGVLQENFIIFSGMFAASFLNYASYSNIIWARQKTKTNTVLLQ